MHRSVSAALIWIAFLWAVFLCWAGRHTMLDDALIHLRYAAVLHDRHIVSYDGVQPNYGTSSLLYVCILALLRSISHSPLLPKVVSLLAYAGLLAVVYGISRINRLAAALIFVLVSPFGVRWLTDGMETSLACLLSVAFAILLYRNAPAVALGIAAAILSLLRVDLTLLVAFGVLLMLSQREWLRAGSLCIGSGLAMASIRIAMGHVLPDTAIAKEGVGFFTVITSTAHTIGAAFSFGLGAVLVWAVSAVLAWRVGRRSALIANLPFPALVLLAAVKGQEMQGIRYVIWALLFSISWNLVATASAVKLRGILLAGFACALVVCWTVELPIVLTIDRARTETLADMERANLDRLQGEGLAEDVGYIGYFSQAPICDLGGLVDGREAAQLTTIERNQRCLARQPAFLFVTADQFGYVDQHHTVDNSVDWMNCGSVEFRDVRSWDRHWLLVRRSTHPNGCTASL